MKSVENIFPPPVMALPEADIPIPGITAYLSQAKSHQVIFMHFSQDVDLPEHAHAEQWGIVLEGSITLTIGGEPRTYGQGQRYFIPAGMPHSGRIHAGYADITYFNQPDRYQTKEEKK